MVLLCIGGVAAIAAVNAGGGSSGASDSGTTPAPPDSTADVTCEQPPSPPASAKSFDEVPDASLSENSVWDASVSTNCGTITLELYGDKAPQTVASFIHLAREDYYVDSPCHRLTTAGSYVLQCGDPTGAGSGNPGYGFGIENAPADGVFSRGTVAMARSQDPNSNGGQFFIVYDDTTLPTEGGGYSIFGRVTGGMAIVDKIVAAGVGGAYGAESPAQPISILDVTVDPR